MKRKIQKPKVFISYAWGNEEYQSKVLAFASQLVGVGIDVVLDKWNLSEGNDTYAFMEQCVTDETITNVLILLDPIYAKKADEHSGGVGTETQIISVKVYQEVTQDKFIPIVMERDENGNICKPTYLQGRLHFDLSVDEDYDNTYKRLVKTLYGEDVYIKPELGKKPAWVEQPVDISPKNMIAYSGLKNIQSVKAQKDSFRKYLFEFSKQMLDFVQRNQENRAEGFEYIALYDSISKIKTDFLLLLENSSYVGDAHKIVSDFFEETTNALKGNYGQGYEMIRTFLHELFLYTLAYYIKTKDYVSAGYILGKTYFNEDGYSEAGVDGFHMFYSARMHMHLSQAVSESDDKNYYSGTAAHWIETISSEFITKEQFVLADLLCFNYSLYGKNYVSETPWFPITYVYDNEFDSSLKRVAKRLVSNEYLQQILILFGYKTIEEFVIKFQEVESNREKIVKEYRYSSAWYPARILGDFVKCDEIGSLR